MNFVLDALALVCDQGWQLLPYYIFSVETGEWLHLETQVLDFLMLLLLLIKKANLNLLVILSLLCFAVLPGPQLHETAVKVRNA